MTEDPDERAEADRDDDARGRGGDRRRVWRWRSGACRRGRHKRREGHQGRHPARGDDQLHRLPEPIRGPAQPVVQRLRDGVPAARAVRPRPEARGRLGDELVAFPRRAHLDVPPEARRQVVGRHAADRRRCRLDGQPDHQVRRRADLSGRGGAQPREGHAGAERGHARDPLLQAGRERAAAARAVLGPARARVEEVRRQQRQGPEDVPARAEPADGRRGRVLDHQVPGEGHHGVQAQPVLLRAEVERGRRRDDVLHELDVDDRRPAGGQHRLRRPGAVQRHRLAQVRRRASCCSPCRATRSRTSP